MKKLIGIVVSLLCLMTLWGGGFWIEASAPNASAPRGTVAEVVPVGCHEPGDAVFRASAEGVVNGSRQSIPLKEVRTEAGALAIQRQWPAEGQWVLAVTGTYRGQTRSVLIQIDPYSGTPMLGEEGTRMLTRSLTEKDILAALKSLSKRQPTE